MSARSEVTSRLLGAPLNAPGRLQGVDLARGLAVFGMLAVHLLTIPEGGWSDPATWPKVANGQSSILFAVLAGVSIALVTGGAAPFARGPVLTRARWALAIRGVLLWLIGIALVQTGVPIAVILPAYGILFLLALPLLRLRARALWLLTVVLGLVMPWVQPLLYTLPIWHSEIGHDLGVAIGWRYPFPVWIVFLVAGLAAGRSDLRSTRTLGILSGVGSALAVAFFVVDAIVARRVTPGSYLGQVLTAAAHSSGLFEVGGSGGLALAIIAVSQLACRSRAFSAAALPLRAVGSMPLTAYVGQVVVWAIVAASLLGNTADLYGMRELNPLVPFLLGTMLFCTVWALLWGRGPLEALMAIATRRLRQR